MLRSNALVLSMMLVGCGAQPKDEFATATPSASALALTVPESGSTQGASSSALLGEKPGLYTFTRTVSRAVNDGVGAILARIEFITDHPPTQRDGNQAAWGPMSSGLDPAEWTLVVERVGVKQYNYVLAGKPKGADDSQYKAVMAGHANVVDETHGSGEFLLDFSAIKALDDTARASGGIAVHYDNVSNPRNVEVAFKDFTDMDGTLPRDALYRYAQHPDHSGNFEFVTLQDIDKDGATKEVVGILSRWDATGAGRSDAAATGGSLADLTVHVEECWTGSFGESYYHDNLSINPTEGDPASCVF